MSRESIPSSPSKVTIAAKECHDDHENSMSVWQPAFADFVTALPHTFARLSPTRASLLHDQIREILRSESAPRLICVAAVIGPPILDESMIAIASLTPGSDTASMLHVDWADPSRFGRPSCSTVGQHLPAASRTISASHAAAIWEKLESIFLQSDVRFVQWATDPVRSAASRSTSMQISHAVSTARTHTPSAPIRWSEDVIRWPENMKFTPIGTLEYLSVDSGSVAGWNSHERPDGAGNATHRGHPRVTVEPLDQTDPDECLSFRHLVERTYVDSLDCPSLAEFRTAAEIIQSYRDADSFAADLWYTVKAVGEVGSDPNVIGCIILARHPAPSTRDPTWVNPACVVELVYMGIVPEDRGQDYGQAVMAVVTEVCQQLGAERLILAVDEANEPAIAAYRRFGMRHLFRETVWGRSVGAAENDILA